MTGAKTESKISGTYQELVGRKHAFTYDHQGNRLTHSRNSHTTSYTTNNLNQYTARTNHGYLFAWKFPKSSTALRNVGTGTGIVRCATLQGADPASPAPLLETRSSTRPPFARYELCEISRRLEGTSSNAAVKVYETGSTEETATRKNDYYFRDWDPNTSSTASDYPEINVKEGTTVSATKNAWIPGVSETPITYDANGNLTGDALWTYTYDEENRLISMAETAAAATAGFPDTIITFKYDYLGRRVEKKVVRGTVTESHLRFVWRGWLLVAELNAASDNALVKTYTWGPDVSGSLGGAGGNGGVLIMKDHTSTVNESFYPAYDARGNVTGLIDTAGNLDAAYEYDPFGKLIRYAGTRSSSMSLLYGTKYTDMETGLIYYGHRYYDPRQGRFINRDPIAEKGGINLYGFVGNNPVNGLDFLGLCESEGDTNEYGEEICSDEHALQPFVIDGTPTDEDLMIWARQDDDTERLIEELNSQDLNLQSNVDPGNSSPVKKVVKKKKKKPEEEEEEWTEEKCRELAAQIAQYENELMPMVGDMISRVNKHVGEMTGERILGHVSSSNFVIGTGLTAVQSSEIVRRANNTLVTVYTKRGIALQRYGTGLARGLKVAGNTVGVAGVGLELYNVTQADSALDATLSAANAGATGYGLYSGIPWIIGVTIAYNTIDIGLEIFYLNPKLDEMAMDLVDQSGYVYESTVNSYEDMVAAYQANCVGK